MRYKIFGYIVWHAGMWFAGRWQRQHKRELTMAGAGASVLLLGLAGAGAAVAAKRGDDH